MAVDIIWLLIMLSGWVATFLVVHLSMKDTDYWMKANRENRDLYWAEQEKVKDLERQIEKVYSVIVKPGKN
jgi:hypothetical protein